MLLVKKRELQRINHAAHGINNSSGKEPAESGMRQNPPQRAEHGNAGPAQGKLNHRGKPFRAGNPEGFQRHAKESDSPYGSQKGIAGFTAKDNQADRRVGAGNQHKNHHVVQLAENAQGFPGEIQRVVGCAGAVEQYHADTEDT